MLLMLRMYLLSKLVLLASFIGKEGVIKKAKRPWVKINASVGSQYCLYLCGDSVI